MLPLRLFSPFLAFFSFLIAISAQAQPVAAWTQRVIGSVDSFGSPATLMDTRQSQVVDGAGNVYVVGSVFAGTGKQWMVHKIDGTTGAIVWSLNDRGDYLDASDGAVAAVLDSSGNLIVVGSTGNSFGSAITVVKYNSATGAPIWKYRSTPFNSARAIAVDASGNVFVTGAKYAEGTKDNMFSLKLNGSDGTLAWSDMFVESGSVDDSGVALAVDASGNVVVTGYSVENSTVYSIRTIKYHGVTGARLWSAAYNGQSGFAMEGGNSVAIDSAGNVIVVGTSAAVSGDAKYIRAIKYHGASGAQLWTVFEDGYGADVALDSSGNAYVVGTQGEYARILKLSSATGATMWAASHTELKSPKDIAIDSAGNVAIIGYGQVNYSPNLNIRAAKYNGATGAPMWNWLYDAAGEEDRGVAVAFDPAGNAIVTGRTLREPVGRTNARTFKLAAATGALVWNVKEPPALTECGFVWWPAKTISVDPQGNVVTTGYCSTVELEYDYNPNSGIQTRITKYDGVTGAELWTNSSMTRAYGWNVEALPVTSDQQGNVFTPYGFGARKYDNANGQVLWTAQHSPVTANVVRAIVTDPAGHVIVSGFTEDSSVRRTRTIKYNGQTGAPIWNMAIDTNWSQGNAISLDPVGNVFVGGYISSASGYCYRLLKHDGATGAVLWDASYCRGVSGSSDQITAMVSDTSGNVYVTGYSAGLRTIKYNGATGTPLWNVVYSGSGESRPYSIALGTDGHPVITGYSTDATGGQNMRTIKYHGSTGAELWNTSFNGTANGEDHSHVVMIDSAGDAIVTGYSTDTASERNIRTIKYNGITGAQMWNLAHDGGAGRKDGIYDAAIHPGGGIFLYGISTEFNKPTGLFLQKLVSVPNAPLIGTAVAGNTQISVTFTPGGNNGSPILDFTATCGPRSVTSTSSPVLVTGLSNGTAYTCTVVARNAIGTSSPSAASNSVTPSAAPSPARYADFNGDGKSDLLWYNQATGMLYQLQMDGFALGPGAVIDQETDLNWQVVGVADLNGDGRADVVWHNSSTGAVYGVLMSGNTVMSEGAIYVESNLQWKIEQLADLDGDGRADLVWKNQTTGEVYAMKMDGLSITAGQVVYAEPNLEWKIVAAGDMNGDGKADLLWRNQATGDVFVMLMNGFTVASGGVIYNEPNLNWRIVGLADFNNDGRADMLWHNTATGDVFEMQMNGTLVSAGQVIYNEPNIQWKIVGLGDYNGDGRGDILWRHVGSGQVYLMLMNGFSLTGGAFVYTEPDPNWRIVGGSL